MFIRQPRLIELVYLNSNLLTTDTFFEMSEPASVFYKIIDLTRVDDPPKLLYVDPNDPNDPNGECCIGYERIEDGTTCYRPPCGHVFCQTCMKDNRVRVCGRCAQEFMVAEPVRVLMKNHTITIE
ncbi:hypothetical protein PBPMD00_12 [Pinkberry virus LS07-2018-MD00]|jgi:hypothetical protein|nr:hypothetical protein PBPMD00_12 [Pinkberry virus LS07-2018-MD00]